VARSWRASEPNTQRFESRIITVSSLSKDGLSSFLACFLDGLGEVVWVGFLAKLFEARVESGGVGRVLLGAGEQLLGSDRVVRKVLPLTADRDSSRCSVH